MAVDAVADGYALCSEVHHVPEGILEVHAPSVGKEYSDVRGQSCEAMLADVVILNVCDIALEPFRSICPNRCLHYVYIAFPGEIPCQGDGGEHEDGNQCRDG